MEVFKWNPQIELSVEYDQAIREIQFGDGIEQISEDGLNSLRQVFSNVRFTDHESGEVKEVFDFFMRHRFTKRFRLDIRGYSAIVRFTKPFRKIEKGGKILELQLSMKEVFE